MTKLEMIKLVDRRKNIPNIVLDLKSHGISHNDAVILAIQVKNAYIQGKDLFSNAKVKGSDSDKTGGQAN